MAASAVHTVTAFDAAFRFSNRRRPTVPQRRPRAASAVLTVTAFAVAFRCGNRRGLAVPGRQMATSAALVCCVFALCTLGGRGSPADAPAAQRRREGFRPYRSSTFRWVGKGRRKAVNLTFLDRSTMEGFDGQDFVQLGSFRVLTRLGVIQSSESDTVSSSRVDGILGFGFYGGNRSASLLKTLSQPARPGWHVTQAASFTPMPRKFAFLANSTAGELQLGGFDPACTSSRMMRFPMRGPSYGVRVYSIQYGDGEDAEEILDFNAASHDPKDSFVGELDSGTTCVLLPNTTVNGTFEDAPFNKLLQLQLQGLRRPLVFTLRDEDGRDRRFSIPYRECVESSRSALILGDAFFRRWLVLHDLENLDHKTIGLAPIRPGYRLASAHDRDIDRPPDDQTLSLERADPGRHMGTGSGAAVEKVPVSRSAGERRSHQQLFTEGQLIINDEGDVVAGAGAVGRGAASRQKGVLYTVAIWVGTPPQRFEVIFDTGSYMLAVFAAKRGAAAPRRRWQQQQQQKEGQLARRENSKISQVLRRQGQVEAAAAVAEGVKKRLLRRAIRRLRHNRRRREGVGQKGRGGGGGGEAQQRRRAASTRERVTLKPDAVGVMAARVEDEQQQQVGFCARHGCLAGALDLCTPR
jgi:hypothetical protein